MTLHQAFGFEYGAKQHSTWSEKKLAKFRHNLSNLKLIIIDEMSLMDSDKLYKLHFRLCQIFQSEDLFANIGIILIGDILQVRADLNKVVQNLPSLQCQLLAQTGQFHCSQKCIE